MRFFLFFFFFKQKTAYEIRPCDWSSDVCSSDLEVPNDAVDMDSWASSACYPRRTFYPLSDGPSTWDHRITMADFRLCSSCRSRSQAGLCHCTPQLISDQPEPTIARLRYALGGDRPSQTTRHAGSRTQLDGPRLDARDRKGGISRLPPPQLAPGLLWL